MLVKDKIKYVLECDYRMLHLESLGVYDNFLSYLQDCYLYYVNVVEELGEEVLSYVDWLLEIELEEEFDIYVREYMTVVDLDLLVESIRKGE